MRTEIEFDNAAMNVLASVRLKIVYSPGSVTLSFICLFCLSYRVGKFLGGFDLLTEV